MIGSCDSLSPAPHTSFDSTNHPLSMATGLITRSSFVLELLSPFLWPIEIREVGKSFSRISFWDSLLVNSIACPKCLGRIGVRLDRFCLDLELRGFAV